MQGRRFVRFLTAVFVAALAVAVVPAAASAGTKPTVIVQPATAQYSDYVTLRARISPAPTAGTAVFTVDGSSAGLVGKAAYNRRTGIASQLYRVPLPEGDYDILVAFTGPPRPIYTARGCGVLTVKPEDARVVFSSDDGSPLPWLRTYNSTETSQTPPFAFSYKYVEVPDGTPGDLALAARWRQQQWQVDRNWIATTPRSVTAAGNVLPGETYDFAEGASFGTYMFQTTLHGYYRAHGEYAFAVYDPTVGMSAGAGSFINPANSSWAAFAFVFMPGAEPEGMLAYQQSNADQRQHQVMGPATLALPEQGCGQLAIGGILASFTQELPGVPASVDTVAITWPAADPPSDDPYDDFGPTVLTQGAIDLNGESD